MHLEDLNFDLPEDRIAQTPASRRSDSRLMLVDRRSGAVEHARFRDLPDLLPTSAALFRNNASVFKARLPGMRETGGRVECFLLRPLSDSAEPPEDGAETWECLLKPGKRLRPGSTFGWESAFRATVLERGEAGTARVAILPLSAGSVIEVTDRIGAVPLPPYIRRDLPEAEDESRYQTVYADPTRKVAAAAPTAGLHFTPDLLEEMARRGTRFHDLTLHVGLGTFQPVQTERVEDHPIHREFYEIPAETRRAALACRATGARLVAVGTTSMRALEDYARAGGNQTPADRPFQREADLFITPPATFELVEALITNFHLPKSTLLALVAAFLKPGGTDGLRWIKELYREAIRLEYRFFSYGDAMLIL